MHSTGIALLGILVVGRNAVQFTQPTRTRNERQVYALTKGWQKAPSTGARNGGLTASAREAAIDAARLIQVKDRIVTAGRETGIEPAILAGIASRESSAGDNLRSDGYGKYVPDNYGYMQVNKTNHADTTDGPAGQAHFNQAAKILQTAINGVAASHPDWEKPLQTKGGIAAYFFGVGNVRTKENIDIGTARNDFSSDVLARAKYLKDNGIF